jgi:hypothetical protein
MAPGRHVILWASLWPGSLNKERSFLDHTTDQDLWHRSSRNLEPGEHCIRERRFPPMVISAAKSLGRRFPMTNQKQDADLFSGFSPPMEKLTIIIGGNA